MAKKWIQKAIKHPGALKKALGIKSESTIAQSTLTAAAKKKGKVGRMARLAMTLKKLGKR